MKTKRLNRDGWGFQNFPYYQMRIDTEDFHGTACLIKLVSGQPQNWETPKAGKVYVCGRGMTWMTLIPDGESHIITAKYLPDYSAHEERHSYPSFASRQYPVSVWYVDVTEGCVYDPDGVIRYTDKYLDYIFTPEGDVSISDRDELDEAYESGELTREQYSDALAEGKRIEKLYIKSIRDTEAKFARIRTYIEEKIRDGCNPMFLYHGSRYRLDTIKPGEKDGEKDGEAVYAFGAAEEAFPYALPVDGYPEEPDNEYSVTCEGGRAHIIRGVVNPDATGYIYRLPANSFTRAGEGKWASTEKISPIDCIELRVGDHFDAVTWSEQAKIRQQEIYGD